MVAVEQENTSTNKNRWKLNVRDLKSLHKAQSNTLGMAPFEPPIIQPLSSTTIQTMAKPVLATTGQVLFHGHEEHPVVTLTAHEQDTNERSRHFFCGTDWHDAATHCHQHCPSGSASDCTKEGHKCYADTPCDAMKKSQEVLTKMVQDESEWILTPAGGMPAVVTLWSDGTLRLHALTAKKSEGVGTTLKLREMWTYKLDMDPNLMRGRFNLDEVYNLLWLDATETSVGSDSDNNEDGKYGMIIVGNNMPSSWGRSSSAGQVLALDVMTGSVLWDSEHHNELEKNQTEAQKLELVHRGRTSFARRRSKILGSPAALSEQQQQQMVLPNCWHTYRHSLLEEGILPSAFWGEDRGGPSSGAGIAQWTPHHLDPKPKKAGNKNSHKQAKHQWHHHAHHHRNKRRRAIYGKPNVIATHLHDGIHIRSIKNGKSICHLSLLDRVLYGDLNRDGTLDQLQVLTSDSIPDTHQNEWVQQLAGNLQAASTFNDTAKSSSRAREMHRRMTTTHKPCHVLVLSGLLPAAREELFMTNICGAKFARDRADQFPLDAGPPVVVGGTNVVLPLSNGLVTKYNIPRGSKVWQMQLGDGILEGHSAILTSAKVQVSSSSSSDGSQQATSSSQQPILVGGTNGMALIAPKTGSLLASTTFPQVALRRLELVDVTGDGTSDVLVWTKDALWGYQLVVHQGTSIVFRILVGLLLMTIALAVLRNRFGQQQQQHGGSSSSKRSTDE